MDEDVPQLLQKRQYSLALERMLERYEHKVFRLAWMFLKDRARAEDVTQDIFLKLWRALPHYDGRASPGTWLYTIARNTCLSALRSDSSKKSVPLDVAVEPAAATASRPDDELAQCLALLPEIQRNAITLFYLQEKRVDEVARMLDLPENTVKSHLHRARRALGEMMKESR